MWIKIFKILVKLLLPFTKLLNEDYDQIIQNKDYLATKNSVKSNNVNSIFCAETNIKGIIEFYKNSLNNF